MFPESVERFVSGSTNIPVKMLLGNEYLSKGGAITINRGVSKIQWASLFFVKIPKVVVHPVHHNCPNLRSGHSYAQRFFSPLATAICLTTQ